MNNKSEEKSLVEIEKSNILHKIKTFFRNMFKRSDSKQKTENSNILENCVERNEDFWSTIKNIENDETKLLKLHGKYHRGEIEEKDLTEEQIIALCELYDRQIYALQKSNEYRKQKILLYRQKIRIIKIVIK